MPPLNALDALKKVTTVVADTGDFVSMEQYCPQDATTNPSLILQAASNPRYAQIVQSVCREVKAVAAANQLEEAMDGLLVAFGVQILSIVPGRVSTEVDARLSFDTQATVKKARRIIALYEAQGIDRKRVLIKIASTWEGIAAAKILEQEGIACNLTLLFSLCQAIGCAEAGVTLISPFVGRIYDWYVKQEGRDFTVENDPGVASVKHIYAYYKKFGYTTEIMGASFRNVGQILGLAGCDLLTISPDLLAELQSMNGEVKTVLTPAYAHASSLEKQLLSQADFRFALNEDAMATEKTAEGIRRFSADIVRLEQLLLEQLNSQ